MASKIVELFSNKPPAKIACDYDENGRFQQSEIWCLDNIASVFANYKGIEETEDMKVALRGCMFRISVLLFFGCGFSER